LHDINNEKYVFLSWKLLNYQQVVEIKGYINQHHHIKFKVNTMHIDGLHNNLNYKDMMSQDKLNSHVPWLQKKFLPIQPQFQLVK
jgi:hypothetical protein